jgi:hypothetical protein
MTGGSQKGRSLCPQDRAGRKGQALACVTSYTVAQPNLSTLFSAPAVIAPVSRPAKHGIPLARRSLYLAGSPTLSARQAILPLSLRDGARPGSPRALPELIGGITPGIR